MSAATYLRRKFKRLRFVLLMLVLAAVVWFGAPASVRYRVQEVYLFQADDKDGKVRLAALIPRSGPYQAVSIVGVFWDGAQVRESLPCLDILKLEGRLKARQHKEAIIVYDVSLPQGKARWEEAIEGFELQPQKDIESDHPIIVAQASKIVHAQGREDAYRIYKFTAAHLSWRWWNESGTNLSASALKAYQTRAGACGEFANLMVALCRAARIPARTISGLDLPSYPPFWSATRVWGHPGVAHAWTEFHGPAGWEMADPSGAYLMPIKHLWFGRNNGSHLSYGESGAYGRIFGEMTAWARADGHIVAAISDPNKFAAGADASGISISPRVTIKVTWNARWFYLAALALCFVAWRLHQGRRLRLQGKITWGGQAGRNSAT